MVSNSTARVWNAGPWRSRTVRSCIIIRDWPTNDVWKIRARGVCCEMLGNSSPAKRLAGQQNSFLGCATQSSSFKLGCLIAYRLTTAHELGLAWLGVALLAWPPGLGLRVKTPSLWNPRQNAGVQTFLHIYNYTRSLYKVYTIWNVQSFYKWI